MRKFKGKANLKTLLPFLKKHSTSLREHWPAVKVVLDADNAKLSAEKAAVAAKVTQFKVTVEAAAPTDVCCNDDGGVVKRLITEGRGEMPPKGSLIHAQCAATMPPPLSPRPASPPATHLPHATAGTPGGYFLPPEARLRGYSRVPSLILLVIGTSHSSSRSARARCARRHTRPRRHARPGLAPPNGRSFTR